MRALFRHALSSLLIVAAANASAGVITQDGVVFTSTYTGNVLTLEIDAAKRSGGWAGATAIDALSIKTIGNFADVTMSSSTGAAWSLAPSELNARGCASARGKAASAASMSRLCYTGAGVALADNMVFIFTFSGTPSLSAPHLKVHFVDAGGNKMGSLLSLDFPWQAASAPVVSTPVVSEPVASAPVVSAPVASETGSTGSTGASGATGSPVSTDTQTGSSGNQAGNTGTAPELIPVPALVQPVIEAPASNVSLPADAGANEGSSDVPEPRSMALMAAGLALLGVTRRR